MQRPLPANHSTKQKTADEALRASEQRFRELADAIPQIVWTAQADGAIDHVNKRAVEYSGIGPEGFAGWSWQQVIHPEDLPRTVEEWTEVLRSGVPRDIEFRLRRADGQYRWHVVREVPSRGGDGSIVGWYGTATDVHDLKLTEATLRAERDWIAKIVSTVPVVICSFRRRTDGTWAFPFAGPGLVQIYGLRPEDVAENAEAIFTRLHPADSEQFRLALEDSARTLAVWHCEYRVLNPARGEIWVEGHAAPSPEPNGDILWQGYIADITERKRAENYLRESQERLNAVVENLSEGVVIADLNGEFLHWNRAALELHGFADAEESYRRLPTFLDHFQLSTLAGRVLALEEWPMSRLLRGERFRNCEVCVRNVDKGWERIFNYGGDIVVDAVGRQVAFLTMTDITERRQTEEARNLFRALLDRSNDAIEVIDPITGRFLDGNEKAWLSLGYSREQFLNLCVHDIDPLEAKFNWSERMDNMRRAGHLVLETVHRRKDGSVFPVEVNAKYVRLNRDYTVTVVRDITERKRAERRIQAQHSVSRILAESFSLEKASAAILQALCECMDWSLGELWRVDHEANVLRCVLTWHQPSPEVDEFEHISKQLTFAPGVGLPGRVWAKGESAWIPDVGQDGNFVRTASALKAGLRAAVGFPITFGNEVLGVLDFFNQELGQPDDELLEVMTAIGSQIGQFIERQRAEVELRASEERFRQLAENIREVFWLSEPVTGTMLYISPAYEAIWGRESASLYQSPSEWLHAIHPEDRERVRQASLSQEIIGKYDEVYRIVRPDNTVRWIHDRGFPVRDVDGKVYRIAGVAEDITERTLAEAASRQQQQRLEGIVNSAMDGIITIDEDQRVILLNAAAERIFGCKADEVLGQCVARFIPERFRARHTEHVRQFGRTGVAARAMGTFGPISGLRANGEEFPVEASISQLLVEGRKLFTVTCRDVTERARAAETQQLLETQLQQSQKMEAFGQLAGGVAHDFNNLLTVIGGFSELLLAQFSPQDPKRRMLEEIQRAGGRAASLTRQLLAFSRQQILEPKLLDLNAVVSDTEKMLRRLIGEDIQLLAVLAPALKPVKADPGQIEQILMNLVVNARDAMPLGGQLAIETRDVELDESYTRTHSDIRPGRFVMLTVRDTGSGMDTKVKARIFEPFFTTKGVGKGTGLGLAVVHGIVKQSGGSIDVTSEVGAGTMFSIYLPAIDEHPTRPSDHGSAIAPRGPETILLVEDEAGVRDLAAFALQELGYTVLTAASGNAALRLITTYSGKVDLLMTDVVMPGISGRVLAETLLAQYPTLKVLFISGYTDDAVMRHGITHADVAFLQKPFTPNILARRVREVLDQI